MYVAVKSKFNIPFQSFDFPKILEASLTESTSLEYAPALSSNKPCVLFFPGIALVLPVDDLAWNNPNASNFSLKKK